VNTETTDKNAAVATVFFDGSCAFCRAGIRLARRLFPNPAFRWLPLQTSGVPEQLGLPESVLLTEMKIQLANGHVLGGIDAWNYLLRSVWWAWPVGILLSLPGLHWLGQAGYRWVARHRYCLGGSCALPSKRPHHRKIPFFDLP